MEILTLNLLQLSMLKSMIQAYENGQDCTISMGLAAGKTTVMKIFNEYKRHKQENPSYKVKFTDTGVEVTFDVINIPAIDGIEVLKFKEPESNGSTNRK